VNYRWWAGGNGAGGIYETATAADGKKVFATFSEARRALADHLGEEARVWTDARYFALRLRKSGMKDGEVAL